MTKESAATRVLTRVLSALFMTCSCMSVSATEYFVSKDRPDDSGDGLTVETAKRTIQAAIDLTKEGDIVTVLPGVYDEGEGVYQPDPATAAQTARVVITNQCIWLRSSGGKDKTFIKGRHAATDNGLGDGALRCVYSSQYGTIVEGFTICNGAAASGGGIWIKSVYWNYICDCVLSNNVAEIGGAVCGATLLKCKVMDNVATANSSAVYDGRAYNSVFLGNGNKGEMFRYCYFIVGCTIVGNTSAASYQGRNCSYLNCLVLDHSGKLGLSGHSKSNGYATNSVLSCSSSEFEGYGDCEFGVTGHHFVAPAFGDFRLLPDSVAVGKGDAEHILKIGMHSPIAEWKKHIVDTYQYVDFNGNPIPKTGAINCGAVQDEAEPVGGKVVFAGDDGVSWEKDCGGMCPGTGYDYAYATNYPAQWCVKASFSSGKPLFTYKLEPTCTDLRCHFPDADGWFRFSPPPQGETVTNTAWVSHDVYHVDDDSEAADPDGLTPETAFPTIQDAVDAASDSYSRRSYISVAPGVYDRGGSFYKSLSNRVAVAGKTVRIVSTHGAEKTVIVGAPDPDTKGFGPNATRCVGWYHGGRIGGLQGFTLTGGYTGVTPEGQNAFAEVASGGAYAGSMEHVLDCIVTNNHAHWGSVAVNGYFFRCLIEGNTAVRQGTVWNSKMISSVLRGNFLQSDGARDLYSGSVARFCLVDGSVGGNSAKLYGSVLTGNHPVSDEATLERCVVHGVSLDDIAAATGCLSADPCLDRDGGRLLSCSPALGYVDVSDWTVHLRYASGDYLSRPLRFASDGKMTAGAYQWPVQAVSVTVSRGGADPLTVTGGTVGTNALEASSSIAVTAKAKSDSGRRFLGFTVDGVDYPADMLTYTVTPPGEPSGCISVVANYSAVPMAVILR